MRDNISAFHSFEYDMKIKATIPEFDKFYNDIIEIIKLYFNKRINVIDIGCGTGTFAEKATNNIDICNFDLMDVSAKMLSIAKNRLKDYDIKNRFIEADIKTTNFEKDYDVITAVQVLHYFNEEERKQAIQKCYNGLNNGGILFNCENYKPFSYEYTNISLERWKSFQIANGKSETEAEDHIKRFNKEYFPITIDNHINIMRDTGFKSVEIFRLTNLQVGILGIK